MKLVEKIVSLGLEDNKKTRTIISKDTHNYLSLGCCENWGKPVNDVKTWLIDDSAGNIFCFSYQLELVIQNNRYLLI